MDDAQRQRLDDTFTYHPPRGDQQERYGVIRSQAKALALTLLETTPPGREQSLALTKLEEFVMFANAAIARGEAGGPVKFEQPKQPKQSKEAAGGAGGW